MDPRSIRFISPYDHSESAKQARIAYDAWDSVTPAVIAGDRAAIHALATRAWHAADMARAAAAEALADPEYSDGLISNQGQTAQDRAQANALNAVRYAEMIESYLG